MTGQSFDYSVFGLRVRSMVDLPELFPALGEGEPDVLIERGTVAPIASEEHAIATDGGILLQVPEIARYFVTGGRKIRVDAQAGVPEKNVRLFLLGSAFGALLHQRGLLPLHANAIQLAGSAVAFMGQSGAGKSTLAAWMIGQGQRLVADDVCVVHHKEGEFPRVVPGLPRLRLWAEALKLIGKDATQLARSYISEEVNKFDLPVGADSTAASECRLGAIYVLDCGERFAVTPIRGMEAVDAVFANTYRGALVATIGGQKSHWQSVIRLVRETPVFRVSREWDLAKIDDQYKRLLGHARDSAAKGNLG